MLTLRIIFTTLLLLIGAIGCALTTYNIVTSFNNYTLQGGH